MRSPPNSHEPWWAPGTDTGFRQRCASALTHPITVVALATLLLNDLLFKALWPDAWITGKLSDLAWVVFALPLLAFLLSLFTRGSIIGARAAFLTAYAGLPLLYAAFNTFEPVHYWILRGIALASGGMGRTPLDATDSIVIPLGWAIAVWVWRRPALSSDALRLRWGLLVAGIAVLASIATSEPEPDHGIRSLGVIRTGDGSVVVTGNWRRSDDGGVTWENTWENVSGIDPSTVEWGYISVETPRGTFSIEGQDILQVGDDGYSQVAYSTGYLAEWGNLWAQAQQTTDLGLRVLETRPRAIIYDEPTGNLIVALGIQGVLVGTPDGRWTPYAVGHYEPSDFSSLRKTWLLFSNPGIWLASLALSLSMIGVSLFLYRITLSDWAGWGALTLTAISVLSSAVFMLSSGGHYRTTDPYIVAGDPNLLTGITGVIAFLTSVGSIVSCLEQRLRLGVVTLGGLAGMNFLVFLAFLLRAHLGISLGNAQFSSIVLTSIAAILLSGYMRRPS